MSQAEHRVAAEAEAVAAMEAQAAQLAARRAALDAQVIFHSHAILFAHPFQHAALRRTGDSFSQAFLICTPGVTCCTETHRRLFLSGFFMQA